MYKMQLRSFFSMHTELREHFDLRRYLLFLALMCTIYTYNKFLFFHNFA